MSHIGYVLEGKMDITFADGTKTFSQGDGIFIPPGEPGKHRGRVLTDRVFGMFDRHGGAPFGHGTRAPDQAYLRAEFDSDDMWHRRCAAALEQ